MSFTKEDKDYLGLMINPMKEDITELKDQFKDHDNQTDKIDRLQQQMLGALKILGWTVLPVAVSVITWYLTAGS